MHRHQQTVSQYWAATYSALLDHYTLCTFYFLSLSVFIFWHLSTDIRETLPQDFVAAPTEVLLCWFPWIMPPFSRKANKGQKIVQMSTLLPSPLLLNVITVCHGPTALQCMECDWSSDPAGRCCLGPNCTRSSNHDTLTANILVSVKQWRHNHTGSDITMDVKLAYKLLLLLLAHDMICCALSCQQATC